MASGVPRTSSSAADNTRAITGVRSLQSYAFWRISISEAERHGTWSTSSDTRSGPGSGNCNADERRYRLTEPGHREPVDEFEMQPLATHGKLDETPSTSVITLNDALSSKGSGQQQHHQQQDHTVHRYWTPLFLRKVTFVVFIVTFTIMLIALTILYTYSQRNQGLSTASPNLHYLWTYGPTAVFTIIAAFWGQVEYRSKQAMPWYSMSQGPTSAASSILLDYISPWNVVALFRALKASHSMAALAISGSLMIKLLIILSTGLFLPQIERIHHTDARFVATNKFDGSNFDIRKIDGRALLTLLGILQANLTYPSSTTDKYAFQSFDVSGFSKGVSPTLEGVVDIFSADLDCEPANVTSIVQSLWANTSWPLEMQVNASIPACDMVLVNGSVKGNHPGWKKMEEEYPAGIFEALWSIRPCQDEPTIPSRYQLPYWEEGVDRLVLFVRNVPNAPGLPFKFGCIACTPRYEISRGLVTMYGGHAMGGAAVNVSFPRGSEAYKFTNMTPFDVFSMAVTTLNSYYHYSFEGEGLFAILSTAIPQGTESDLLDATILEYATRRAYRAVTAQLAKIYLMRPAEEPFTGTLILSEPRLTMRIFSFALASAVLVLLICIAATMLRYAPTSYCSRDPGSIGGLATVLARSQEMLNQFRCTGPLAKSEMARIASSRKFYTVWNMRNNECSFQIVSDDMISEHDPRGQNDACSGGSIWWQPFSVTVPARVLVLASPVLLVAALETLSELSKRSHGLFNVTSEGYVRYTWVYLPALVMLGVKTLFDMVDSSARMFHPFHALRRGAAPARSSILDDNFRMLAVQSLWRAIRKRQYVIVASTTAMVLTPVLTIAVSGLYTLENTTTQRPVRLRQLDSLNSTNYYIRPKLYEHLMPGVLAYNSLSYPPWTYAQYAFPTLEMLSATETSSSTWLSTNGSLLRAEVPALQGVLNCSIVPPQLVNVTFETKDQYRNTHVQIDLATPGCGSEGNGFLVFNSTSNSSTSSSGYYFDLLHDVRSDELLDCPRAVLGYGRAGLSDVVEDVTVFSCRPFVQLLNVDTTFRLPNYAIDESRQPRPVDGPMTFVSLNYSRDIFSVPFPTLTAPESTKHLMPFFQALVHGKSGIPAEELAGSDNAPTLLAAIEHLYTISIAQVINSNGRIAAPPDATILNGTLSSPNNARLVQGVVSTRILEGVLASIFLCAVVVFYLMDTRRILPMNPCSIAAIASLIAGSEMLSDYVIPKDSEFCDDEELKRRGIFEGWVFSLGWWGQEGTQSRRFGIDIGEAESEE